MTNLPQIHLMNSPHLSLAHQSWPKIVLTTLVLSLAVSGCSNRNPAPTTPTSPVDAPIEQRGDWFCQPAAAGADDPWECIQDKGLATNPKPDRLPNDNQPSIPPARSPLGADPSAPNPQINGNDVPLPPPPPPPGLSQHQGSNPPGSAQIARPNPAKQVTPAAASGRT